MAQSNYSNSFFATVGPAPAYPTTLPNGYTDGHLWVRVKIGCNPVHQWVGPIENTPNGLALSRMFAARKVAGLRSNREGRFYSSAWNAEIGQRYWQVIARQWKIIPVETITAASYREGLRRGDNRFGVQEQRQNRSAETDLSGSYGGYFPVDYPAHGLPLTDTVFGVIENFYDSPVSGENKTGVKTSYFCAGGLVYQDGPTPIALSLAQLKAKGVSWRGMMPTGYNAGDRILTTCQTYVGPFIRQELAGSFIYNVSGPPYISLYTPRPQTKLTNDDGVSDGIFLSGYRVNFTKIVRTSEGVSQTIKGVGIANDSAVYYAPDVIGNALTTTEVSGVKLIPGGGSEFFSFDRVESVLLWAEEGKALHDNLHPSFSGNSSGTNSAWIATPVALGKPEYNFDITKTCQTSYRVTSVYVNRSGGNAVFTDGDHKDYTVAVIPFTVEPISVKSRTFYPPKPNAFWKPYPNPNNLPDYSAIAWWYSYVTTTAYCVKNADTGNYDIRWDKVVSPDGVGSPLVCQVDNVPGANGFSYLEVWGAKNAADPPAGPYLTYWEGFKQSNTNGIYTQAWGNQVPQPAADKYFGGRVATTLRSGGYGNLTIWANIPPGVNGGSCDHAMPRTPTKTDTSRGIVSQSGICTALCVLWGIQDQTRVGLPGTGPCTEDSTGYKPIIIHNAAGNYSPVDYYPPATVNYIDPVTQSGRQYNQALIPVWIADKGQTPPNYDTSDGFQCQLVSGEGPAYWRLGQTYGNVKAPGYGIWGFDVAIPAGDGTIIYTKPVYIRGPYYYFTDADASISADNSQIVPPFNTILFDNPDPPLGTASVGPQRKDVVFYSRPQFYILK